MALLFPYIHHALLMFTSAAECFPNTYQSREVSLPFHLRQTREKKQNRESGAIGRARDRPAFSYRKKAVVLIGQLEEDTQEDVCGHAGTHMRKEM